IARRVLATATRDARLLHQSGRGRRSARLTPGRSSEGAGGARAVAGRVREAAGRFDVARYGPPPTSPLRPVRLSKVRAPATGDHLPAPRGGDRERPLC